MREVVEVHAVSRIEILAISDDELEALQDQSFSETSGWEVAVQLLNLSQYCYE